MMKTIASITAFTLLLGTPPAIAQDVPLCYLQTQEGLLLSLEKLCEHSHQRLVRPLSDQERKFLEDLKQSIEKSSGPQAAIAAIDPEAAINQAKEICSELEAGTFLEYRQAQNQMIAEYSDPTTQMILNSRGRTIQTVAPKYFCPGFDG